MAAKIEIRNFFNGHLNSSESTLYQCPSGKKAIIRTIYMTNGSDATRTVNMRIIRGSDSARIVPYNFQLRAQHTMIEDDLVTMEAGDRLAAVSDVKSVVSCKVSGIEELL